MRRIIWITLFVELAAVVTESKQADGARIASEILVGLGLGSEQIQIVGA